LSSWHADGTEGYFLRGRGVNCGRGDACTRLRVAVCFWTNFPNFRRYYLWNRLTEFRNKVISGREVCCSLQLEKRAGTIVVLLSLVLSACW
jgi:hypothetical protein